MLYIYKASAGSGKTHLLTGFFIQLLFNKPEQPTEYDRPLLFNEILAVTFTNKATAEMKERIIEELHKLYTDPQDSPFIDKLLIAGNSGKVPSLEEISRRAYSILNAMLNDYSSLHVSTIDSFFQQVLRSFAHELNLQGNYEIELDTDTILDNVISNFITNLNPKDDKETFNWMLEFASKRLNEGSGWNVHEELLNLAKVLTAESYQKNSLRIAEFTKNHDELSYYIKQMHEIQKAWKKALIETGQEGMKILSEADVQPSDFKGGARSTMLCFGRWATGDAKDPSDTLKKWAESTDEWYAKGSAIRSKLGTGKEALLQQLMQKGVELLTGDERMRYESARAINKNIYQLGLLSRIEQEAKKYCEEKGIQLLSDTTQLLSRLIQEEESPFIYEKTGTRILSFMIDEFQDTSTLQWNNFKPLLKNSLDTGYEDLIVGDVKQSIYRWRGSDWELLHSTIKGFCPGMQKEDKDHNQLLFNFRSDRKIIQFNNEFFEYAAKTLTESTGDDSLQKVAEIYADVEQNVHKSRENKIKEGFLHYEEVSAEEGESAQDAIMRRLPDIVIALQQQDFSAKDILILGRFNKECKLFAETLLKYKKEHPDCPYKLDIITDEALSLANRDVIRAIVAMLHAIYEPKSQLRRTVATCCYFKACGLSMNEAIAACFSGSSMPDILQFSNQPLFEMVEGLVAILPNLQLRDSVFLQAFRDLALDHIAKRGTDLGSFLKWWDEKGASQSISTPSDQDAIRIMTIHQSKGLGEKAVIIPLANWQIDIDTSHGEILWLDPKEMGYKPQGEDTSIVLPIRLEASLPKTIFKEEYTEERMRAITDNLNTAYVAFTRAKNAMIIMAPAPKKENRKQVPDLSVLLKNFMEKWQDKNDKIEIEKCADVSLQTAVNNSINNTTEQAHAGIQTEAQRTAARPQIKRTVLNRHDKETSRGTAIHNALSAVQYADDFAAPIRQLFLSGRAEIEGMTLDELLATVEQLLATPKVSSWFARGNRIFNEQNIVTHTTHTQRPDRMIITPTNQVIIIDYKTGKTRSSRYHTQVEYYMRLMREMGYRDILGYLWYIDQNHIEQVLPQTKAQQLTFDFGE